MQSAEANPTQSLQNEMAAKLSENTCCRHCFAGCCNTRERVWQHEARDIGGRLCGQEDTRSTGPSSTTSMRGRKRDQLKSPNHRSSTPRPANGSCRKSSTACKGTRH